MQADEQHLIADVYAHPDDDGPRLVYADWLEERGDPRGELIALQCRQGLDEAGERRVRALVKAHGRKWLGPLAPIVTTGHAFRRGFVARATVKWGAAKNVARLGALPAWATVEELDFSVPALFPRGQEAWRRGVTPAMTSLRRLEGAHPQSLLAAARPWRLEQLSCHCDDHALFRQLLASPLFPSLRRLELLDADCTPLWCRGATVAPALAELHIRYADDLAGWLAAVGATPIARLVFPAHARARWQFDPGPDGALSRLELRSDQAPNPTLAAALTRLPRGLLRSFALDGDDDAAVRRAGEALVSTGAPAPATPRPVTFSGAWAAAWSDDGWWIAERGRAVLLDARDGKLLRQLPLNDGAPGFSVDGKRLASAGFDGGTELLALADGKVLARLPSTLNPREARFPATAPACCWPARTRRSCGTWRRRSCWRVAVDVRPRWPPTARALPPPIVPTVPSPSTIRDRARAPSGSAPA
jgi:uncharacterized protein (TIGR02996 family)